MKAIIFDMDGVISDTVDLHLKIQKQVLTKHKLFSNSVKEYSGIRFVDIVKKQIKEKKKKKSEEEIQAIVDEYWDILFKKTNSIKPMKGIKQFLIKLKDNGFRLAIASSSNKKFIHILLSQFRIRSFFEVVITGKQAKGKPSPDLFLLAAKRLYAQPEECIVVEDSLAGMMGAKKAKMKCIGVVKKPTKDKLPCDLVVDSTNKIDIEKLNSFF
jgi:beta-phosphoglucomutase